jgi:hypothetical protein
MEVLAVSARLRLFLTIGGPMLLVLSVTVGVIWWDRGAPPGFRPPVEEVTPETINREHRGVRIQGTLHNEARLKQTTAGSDEVWWLIPMFPKGDTIGREARVLLRTTREPDAFYGFEDRSVEGFARPPGSLLPRQAREALERKDYAVADDAVLVEEWVD